MQTMEKKWHVGIDISKETPDVAVFDMGKNRSNENYLKVGNDASGFKVMREWFRGKGIKLADRYWHGQCRYHHRPYGKFHLL